MSRDEFIEFCWQCADLGRRMGRARADTVIAPKGESLSLKQHVETEAGKVFDREWESQP